MKSVIFIKIHVFIEIRNERLLADDGYSLFGLSLRKNYT